MLRKIKKLASLSPGELFIILHAILLLAVVTVLLRIKGFNGTRSCLEGRAFKNPGTPCSGQIQVAENTTRLVSVVANNIPLKAKCLRRSLVSKWILDGKGIQTNLIIGANKDGTDLSAHAWLELDGQVLNEPQYTKSEYKVLNIEFGNTNVQTS